MFVKKYQKSVKAEIVNKSLAVAPALFNLDPAVKIDLAVKEFFKFIARAYRNAFKHFAALAYNYALVAFALAINCCVNIKKCACP